MHAKLIVLTLGMVMLIGAVLALRQQRWQSAHALIEQHQLAQRLTRDLWQVQADAAAVLTPQHVLGQIDRAKLAMEPATPRVGSPGVTGFADAQHNAHADAP